jgi:hypothetical protein
MGIFDKKFCGVCGDKIGLLGNRKLEDGNLCGNCAKKLSPFFTGRRKTTLADIKRHLAYREANKQEVAKFNVSRQFGQSNSWASRVLIDDSAGKFIVTSSDRWKSENPDVIDVSQITNFTIDIRETREEIKTKDSDGNSVSYSPPRYEYYYYFYAVISVNSPYFSEIEAKLNKNRTGYRGSPEYREFERQAYELQEALKPRPTAQGGASAALTPRTCPNCGAPVAGGKACTYCGTVFQ